MDAWRRRGLFVVGFLVGIVLMGAAIGVMVTLDNSAPVQEGVTLRSPSGTNVTLYGSTNVSLSDPFPNGSTSSSQFADRAVNLTTESGNITLASDADVDARVHTQNLTGTWTNVTHITAGSNTLEVYPESKQRVDVKGDADRLGIRSVQLDDGTTDLYVEGPNNGVATITVYDLPASTTVAAVDPGSGAFLASGTTDANGNLTLDIGLSGHAIQLQTVDDDPPVLSNPEPTGAVSDSPDELRVDVSDPDFADDADEVQVTFYLQGSQIGQTNVTTNGTVTASVNQNFDLGEQVKWNVSAVDSYGNTDARNESFQMPENITLRNESNASQIITDKNITATFYSENGEIVTVKSDSNGDGNISLKGLPDTAFVVTFDGQGWYDRRAYVDRIGEQQNIYLLNSSVYEVDNETAIETTFVYEDRTSEFPPDNTTLEVERAVDPDGDGNYSWAVVAGDFWGAAAEFPFTGQYQERYRLRVTNRNTGESRLLGTHIPVASGVKEIIVGRIIFEAENATGRTFDAGINENTSNLQILYSDPTNQTEEVTIVVHEQGNASNEVFNSTFTDLGTETIVVSLNDSQSQQNWLVSYDGTHSRDGQIYGQRPVGIGGLALLIAPDILGVFGFLMVTFAGALYGPRTALLGAWAMVFMAAGLQFLGLLQVGGVALTVMIIVAVGGTFYKEAMPS
ncbi:hypothetical protein EGH24_13860 [Halonotius terrestris]|uniref:Uncharacterized protein n=1 Tax=Halonotius terrestris TaxID=2487750 RepID=A0A8J8P9N8_9EURY|nr:MHS family MFS transporter [Halonotius terrestris]TQQ78603.1 hypothetical protein EGH24_13860 [Halonotius terrestris]